MNARLLKRNISTDAPIEPPKRPKLRKPLDTRYETPHPSLLSSDSAFKLPSSVGPAESPSKFSPIPSTKRTHRRTSSTNLKENASVLQTSSPFPQPKQRYRRVKKYGKASRRRPVTLESPFNSCSSSASSASSPESLPNPRTLSDLRLNTNISRQASHSTVSSPILVESPIRLRRPSAPTPPRISSWNYVPSHTVSAIDLHAPPSDPEFHLDADLPPDAFYPIVRPSPNHSQLDFNRPPSQLSMYDYNRSVTLEDAMDVDKADPDAFFSDVRGTSTPFKHLGSLGVTDRRFGGTMDPTAFTGSALSLQSAAEFPDTDTDSDPDGCSDEDMEASRPFRLLQQAWKNKSKARSGYVTPSEDSDEEMGPRSPWISDSLISPPKTADWALVPGNPKHSAYKQAGSADPDDDMAMDEEQRIPEQVLEGLLDNLMIAQSDESLDSFIDDPESQCLRLPLRTRSLDTSLPAPVSEFDPAAPVTSGTRRTRSGTVIPGPVSKTSAAAPIAPPAIPKRTRSGTVVPGSFGSTKSVPAGDGDQGASVPGPSAPNPPSRCASSSSSLTPSLPIGKERSSAGTKSIPAMARRARSGSIMAPDHMPGGSSANFVSAPRTRNRSGSIVAHVGNTLASLPSQAAGIMRRSRSGTVVPAPLAPALVVERTASTGEAKQSSKDASTPPQDEDLEITLANTTCDSKLVSTTHDSAPRSPFLEDDGDDTLNFLDGPMVFSNPKDNYSPAHSVDLVTDANTVINARSLNSLRARAKAAASKAKGLSKALAGKGGARGKGMLTGPEAGAAALARARARAEENLIEDGSRDGENSSDDELLLK